MTSRRPRAVCQCPRSLPLFSSTLLFLSIVLPASSYAQITDPAPSTTFSPSPTTFQTSVSSSSSPSTTSSAPASTTQSDSPITPSVPPTDPDDVQDHVFNYYFLIIAIVAVLFCLCILYVGRRKKRKAALLRSQSQRALATDVAGFRARFGNRTGRTNAGSYGGGRPRLDRLEGLDERGEAPPPYVPGSKPPSIRSTDGVLPSTSALAADADGLELGDMRRPEPVHHPPGYNEHVEADELDLRRPDAVAAANRRSRSPVNRQEDTDRPTNV
ncbi:uncharacterized protein LY89DRAFT_684330 [Mollisia scopiformis]|uniref:Transmembrane protein n=1 Tax=Mollisia scopiformis TaxID=149040 RepID=A0A194XE48_MOLSC|nr:uncharacterized protein LY89DRAFT_684330 [Mollisia scopiformis]KUJ18424.1 hypothetical protein LY89DRAFT_684330 [Mollisia scopiformis]